MTTAERSALAFFRPRLRRAGTPARAASERAYLKSNLRFYGAGVPAIRAAVLEYCRQKPDLTRSELRALAETLYATNVHELRSAAIGVLERQRARLTERDLPWVVGLVRSSNTWAHVDWIAPKVIGDVIARYPRSRSLLTRWAADGNFWVRRTALLAEHDALRAGGGDFALFARLAAGMLDEREFFIRKAIGWVLREVSKRRPELVYGFLRDHRDRVSRLTLQEGAKYLPVGQRLGLGLSAQAAWVEREERRKRVKSDPARPTVANRASEV